MRQSVDVLAIFEEGAEYPRPVRFKIFENGIKKTVDVSEIADIKHLGAGGKTRIEYTCNSAGQHGRIEYKLLYLYQLHKWEIEIRQSDGK